MRRPDLTGKLGWAAAFLVVTVGLVAAVVGRAFGAAILLAVLLAIAVVMFMRAPKWW